MDMIAEKMRVLWHVLLGDGEPPSPTGSYTVLQAAAAYGVKIIGQFWFGFKVTTKLDL